MNNSIFKLKDLTRKQLTKNIQERLEDLENHIRSLVKLNEDRINVISSTREWLDAVIRILGVNEVAQQVDESRRIHTEKNIEILLAEKKIEEQDVVDENSLILGHLLNKDDSYYYPGIVFAWIKDLPQEEVSKVLGVKVKDIVESGETRYLVEKIYKSLS